MSLLDDFMLTHNQEADDIMGTVTMVVGSQTFKVVENLTTKSVDGDLGGLETPVQNVVTAQPRHVTNPRALLNKRCTVDGVSYRIHSVDIGKIAIHFSLTDPSESR